MSSKKSVTTYLTAALLLCILLPTGVIGGVAYWFASDVIKDNRIINVGRVADSLYEILRMRLHRDDERGKKLLDILITACRHSDQGINACAKSHIEQFTAINRVLGLTFHSGIESDLALGADAVPFEDVKKRCTPDR